MAIASEELAAALNHFATVAEANVQAKAEAEAEVHYSLEAMQPVQFEAMPDFWIEPLPLIHTLSVVGPIWNPAAGRDIHLEVSRLMALQYVPFTLAPAP